MNLAIDIEPAISLVEASQLEFMVFLVTLAGCLAFLLTAAVGDWFSRRSQVERIIRRRFGV